MHHSGSLVLHSNNMEPYPTLLILSKSGVRRIFAVFWTKKLWPPSSPDLNLMDFTVWSILDSNACLSYHQSVMLLKAKLKHCWDKISPQTICASCNQFTDRWRRVVEAKEGYNEKKLFHCYIAIFTKNSINILFL